MNVFQLFKYQLYLKLDFSLHNIFKRKQHNNYISQLFSIKPQHFMYKLWRRQLSKPNSPDQNVKRKQNQFTQLLFQIIKIIRKKQQFFIRILFTNLNPSNIATIYTSDSVVKDYIGSHLRQQTFAGFSNNETINTESNKKITSVNIYAFQTEQQNMQAEEEQVLMSIKGYQQQHFFLSKTYLYTMFVRLLEVYEYTRQKILLKVKNEEQIFYKNWEKLYEDNKSILTESYQNLVYFQNFNVLQLVNTALKKQNHRIHLIVPARIKKNQISLKPLVRINSQEIKKTHSIQLKIKKDQLTDILNKKLETKPKILQTQKRFEQKKKNKQKNKQKIVSNKALYNILDIKFPKIQQGYAFRRQMQLDALQRNQAINDQRKKWERKCEQRQFSEKSLKPQRQFN